VKMQRPHASSLDRWLRSISPNYRNNWLRSGFTEDDLGNGGSDKFIDATFAWGNVDRIKARIQEHFDAGADHICIQPVNPNGTFGDLHWEALEAIIR